MLSEVKEEILQFIFQNKALHHHFQGYPNLTSRSFQWEGTVKTNTDYSAMVQPLQH
jgi:hypothetical protein